MDVDRLALILWAATILVVAYLAFIRGIEELNRLYGYVYVECGNTLPPPSPAAYAYCEMIGCTCTAELVTVPDAYVGAGGALSLPS